MEQRARLLQLITDFCQDRGSRTFTLQELYSAAGDFSNIGVGGKTPEATVRRLLQELRDQDSIAFMEKRGAYSLKGIDILDKEVDTSSIELISATKDADKKEYLIEVYARNRGWVKQAKDVLGYQCLYPKCTNTFLKEDNTPYIEVHHIVPLCKGGDDGIWNLSVLCAHHHRMAHYAKLENRLQIEKLLLRETESRL